MLPADQRLNARGRHVAERERGLVGEEELLLLDRLAEIHVELHAALDVVLHLALEHRVAVLSVPLGAVHRDVRVAQQILRRRPLSDRDPDAGRDRHARLLLGAELEGVRQRLQDALCDQLRADRRGQLLGDHNELVAAEAPEGVSVADDALEPRGHCTQQFVADAMAERVVDALEVVDVDEQRRDRRLAADGACEHLLDAIEYQRAVGQAGQGVVRSQERQLLLAPRELFVGATALRLEALAYAQEVELNAQLHHVQRLRQGVGRDLPLDRDLAEHARHHVSPPQRAPGDLGQRRRSVRSQLAEDLRGLARRGVRHLEALARDPASDRVGRALADPFEAVLHHRVDALTRAGGVLDRLREHLVRARSQRLAEHAQLLAELLRWSRRGKRDPYLAASWVGGLGGHIG